MQTLPVTPDENAFLSWVTPGERIAVKAAIVRAADTVTPYFYVAYFSESTL